MSVSTEIPVTQLLDAVGRGEACAHERLWTAIYDELHALAQDQMVDEVGVTLQSTALVHEVYLRLIGGNGTPYANRRALFAAAVRVMREIRVDYARKRIARRRNEQRVDRDDHPAAIFDEEPAEVLAVDEALSGLEASAPRTAEVVLLRYFGGLTVPEAADVMDVSVSTIDRDWQFARCWLHRALSGSCDLR